MPVPVRHGSADAYAPRDGREPCRCAECVAGNTSRHSTMRAKRFDRRVEVDGRLTAPVEPELHGRMSTYNNWGCRCVPCTEAATSYKVDARRRAGVERTEDLREDGQ